MADAWLGAVEAIVIVGDIIPMRIAAIPVVETLDWVGRWLGTLLLLLVLSLVAGDELGGLAVVTRSTSASITALAWLVRLLLDGLVVLLLLLVHRWRCGGCLAGELTHHLELLGEHVHLGIERR